MKNYKKMIVPLLLAVAGILEMTLHGFEILVKATGSPEFYVPCLRFTALAITVIVAVMQKPWSFE
jgi:hypothetical protein